MDPCAHLGQLTGQTWTGLVWAGISLGNCDTAMHIRTSFAIAANSYATLGDLATALPTVREDLSDLANLG